MSSIDFSPLIPLVNSFISDVLVPAAYAAVPVVSAFVVRFLLQHGALKDQQTADVVGQRLGALLNNVVQYDADKLKAVVPLKLEFAVSSERLATLANYTIAQAPDLLTKAGMDPTTVEGQRSLVRVLTAKLGVPPPPKADLTLDVTNKDTKS